MTPEFLLCSISQISQISLSCLCSLGLKVVLGECEGFTKIRKVTDDESLFGLGVARDKVAALNLPFELFPRRSLKASLGSKPLPRK